MHIDEGKDDIILSLTRVLENDAAVTSSSAKERAIEIMEKLTEQNKIDFSPTRYGTIRTEDEKTMLSIYEKGHNFYNDLIIEEIDITALKRDQST